MFWIWTYLGLSEYWLNDLEVTIMLRSIMKSVPLRVFLRAYFAVVLVLYPVSRMYANEYETVPIKFEFAFLMVIVGVFCNTGILLALSEWGLKHKKTTCGALLFTTIINAILLLMTNGNPLHFIANQDWNTVRYLCFYTILALGAVFCAFVGGYRSES